MRRSLCLIGIWAAVAILMALAMPLIVQRYAATDNVRELFRDDARFHVPPHAWFFILCLFVPATAATCVRQLSRRRLGPALFVAIAAPVAGWYCLRFSVTVESIHDILGTPVLGWPFDLEYVLRFSAVFCTLWFITLIGILPAVLDARESRPV